jgi:hypothetical protein
MRMEPTLSTSPQTARTLPRSMPSVSLSIQRNFAPSACNYPPPNLER